MRLGSSRSLVQYWDGLRAGRLAPQRCEIEPADIATLLPVTFILDCSDASGYWFRLAGTSICEQLGRELRGVELRQLVDPSDQRAMQKLLESVTTKGGVGTVRLEATCSQGREVAFEMVVMPVIHASRSVNRLLGSLSAIDHPIWLGSAAISPFRITAMDLEQAARTSPASGFPRIEADGQSEIAGAIVDDGVRKFRVYEGGRSQ